MKKNAFFFSLVMLLAASPLFGVVINISRQLAVPVVYVGVGEGIDDLEDFDSQEFSDEIFGENA